MRIMTYDERSSGAMHTHSEGQFVYPLKGGVWTQVGMEKWYIHSSSGLWIPPHMPHGADFRGKTKVVAFYLEEKQCLKPLRERFSVRVSPLLRELLGHVQTMNTESVAKNRNLFKLIIEQIIAGRTQDICLPFSSEPRLLKCMNYVISRIDQDPSLVEAARAAGGSPKTLERLFLKNFESDFRSWKQTVKMVMAAAYLHDGMAITDVALSVGYESMSAFIHCFKRHYRTTPSRYLK